jgi:hypothetical protein
VLVVSTTEGMLHGILCHTTNLGPAITLDSILMVGTSSLEKGLIGTSTSGNNTDLGTHTRRDSLLSTRRQTKTSGSLVLVVRNNDGKGTRSTCKGTTITNFGLNVAHNGTLWHCTERKNISDSQTCFLSTVDELSGVHALGTKHEFSITLETVSIQKLNLGHGSSTTRVVENLLDNTTDVTLLFSIVEGAKFHGTFTGSHVRLENPSLSLPLRLS